MLQEVFLLELDMTWDGSQLVGVYSTLEKAQGARSQVNNDAQYGEWQELIPKRAWAAYESPSTGAGWALLIKRLIVDEHWVEPPVIQVSEGPG